MWTGFYTLFYGVSFIFSVFIHSLTEKCQYSPNSDSFLLTLLLNLKLFESEYLNCQMKGKKKNKPKKPSKAQTRKKDFIQLEKIVGFVQYLKTTIGQRILVSALSHFTIIWFQIKDIDCFARCEEEEKISLETISSLHYFDRSKESRFYLQQRAGTNTFQYMEDFRAH